MPTEIAERKRNEAAIAHIEMLQGIINRMASNSSSCKNWCILMITAILALYASKDNCPCAVVLVSIVPTVLFYFTDSYYLGLERKFRMAQKNFNEKLNTLSTETWQSEIFKVTSAANEEEKNSKIFKEGWQDLANGMFSFSTIIFYGAIIVMMFLIFLAL